LAVDQLNVATGVNAQNDTPLSGLSRFAAIGVGAAMIFIRPRMHASMNSILQTVDYTSPFYEH